MKKYKEITITLIENNKVKFSSKNCENGSEQLSMLLNTLMLFLSNIKLHNKWNDIDMEKYYFKIFDDLRNGANSLEKELIKDKE